MLPRHAGRALFRMAVGAIATVVVLSLSAGTALPATGPFPLQVMMTYQKATGAVTVKGSALPGTVVQVRNASTTVKSTGTYALKTSMPMSLVAVRQGNIRRFRFDLPAKAKPYVTELTIRADLTRMWSVVTGFLSLTEHPPATITVQHVEKGTTYKATLTKGNFLIWLPVVRGTNTLHWYLQVGPTRWPGPDLTFTAQ